MACLNVGEILPHHERNAIVSIPNYKFADSGNYVVYVIKVNIGGYTWTVERRFRDFAEFDVKRFENRKKSFLPPKKFIGNKDPEFLNERRSELENYIRTVVELELWLLKKRKHYILPVLTAHFLDFHSYEVHSLVESLSVRLASLGEKWLREYSVKPKFFEFRPIDLYAITERLKLAEPTLSNNYGNGAGDLANTMEFLHKARAIKVRGSEGSIGTSNISHNSLPISLQMCKNLLALWITHFDVVMLSNIATIRKTCKRLIVHFSMKDLSSLLKSDTIAFYNGDIKWTSLQVADFSFNELEKIDDSIISLSSISKLNLSNNRLTDVGESLQHLTSLSELYLSRNRIQVLDDWHLKLGNIKRLYLANNNINSAKGLEKILSLEFIDLSDNEISEIVDISSIGGLPCLVRLILRGNPIRHLIDYRTKVLECFEDRAAEVRLDSSKPNQHELDKIQVRVALRKAEKEREAMQRIRREEMLRRLEGVEGSSSDLSSN